MALNLAVNTVISADAKGVIEYWDVDTFQMPKKPKISFDYKTETGIHLPPIPVILQSLVGVLFD